MIAISPYLGEMPKWSAAPGPCWGLLEGLQHGKAVQATVLY